MNQKISSLLSPKNGIYFLCLLLFAGLTALLKAYYLAAGEAAAVLLLFLYSRHTEARRRKGAQRWLERLADNVDQAARDTTLNCPIPVAVFQPDTDDMVWTNDKFLAMTGAPEHVFDTKLSAAVPGFQTRWLLEGKTECPEEVTIGSRRYRVYGHLAPAKDGGDPPATTYWVDVTEYSKTMDAYKASRPVVALMLLDNYEDTLKGIDENVRARILSDIMEQFHAWTKQSSGMFCRLDRDRYLFVFEERDLKRYIAEKFSVLDRIHGIVSPNGIPVTLSIGVGMDVDSYDQLYQNASLSLEMALSRGGDQAVIKNRFSFEFYGGRSKETEKRTKVKSRVMASALGELVADASRVFVMGHQNADMDCVGAAAGVCAIARKRKVEASVVMDPGPCPGSVMVERLKQMPEYRDIFLTPQDAMIAADRDCLLVVVDTNRPEQVQSRELLESCNKVAVIDHHRRAATYIEGAALNFHEPYASSASELVTELISYIMEPADLLRGEAEALMAGLMLDTKNFTTRTGGRTFEAAAFLRRSGADTGEVKKFFQNDLNEVLAKYDILRAAKMYRGSIAIAPLSHTVDRVAAAQASDELLNIAGIDTSFVLFPSGERIIMSARSSGSTNVQVIVEALGGGGNAAVAGAQIAGKTVEEVTRELVASIDSYFESEEKEG